ncbi:MAG: hypothetical protein WAZ27_02725 [Minisyncoccia bacterium]
MKTAVLIHGHFLGTPDWERVEWGDPAHGTYGNIPKGLVEALRFDADTIIFGTGASEKDGLKEGEYGLHTARERMREIPEFKMMETDEAHAWLEQRAMLELTAQNTIEEIRAGARIAKERGAERLIQVACRTHSARAYKFALAVLREDPLRPFLANFYSVASDTEYDGADMDSVVVFEPPHRPDRPKVFFNTTLQEVVGHLSDARAPELNDALKRAISEYRSGL